MKKAAPVTPLLLQSRAGLRAGFGLDLLRLFRRGSRNRDLARLQLFGNVALEVDMQQAVLQQRAFDLDTTAVEPLRSLAKVYEQRGQWEDVIRIMYLQLEGLAVAAVGDGNEALARARAERFDLIVLDLMLPGLDGVTVCRAIRRDSRNIDAPILMLTARRDEADKVLGLDSGADDYLTKPFGVRELVARARALLRRPRASRGATITGRGEPITAGPLRLDPARHQAVVHTQAVELTPHEFDVLYLLASNPGIVFTREMLLERVWTNDTHVTERSVDTLIKRLRQKIELDTRDPQLILTEINPRIGVICGKRGMSEFLSKVRIAACIWTTFVIK